MPHSLIAPHGGSLVDPIVGAARAEEIKAASRDWPSLDLSPRHLCDIELLLNGGFSPLTGFLGKADYERVVAEMRLADGTLWPIPIMLDVDDETAARLSPGAILALRDAEGVMLAALHVSDVWQADREHEALTVFGTTNREHPAVNHLLGATKPWYVGGRLEGLTLPHHYDYQTLRLTPAELRERFARRGWRRVAAFQTRNPMHRAHLELTVRAAKQVEANLLINPVVGMTKPGDVDHYTRVRAYQAIMDRYPDNTAELALLPLAMRLGGPREAVWHAIIRKNYGCTHLIVGRDHAGPGSDSSGKPFYGPYDAQELVAQHEAELGVGMVPFQMVVYLPDEDRYVPEDEVPPGGQDPVHLRHRAAQPPGRRPGDPGVVHLPQGGRGAAPHPPAAQPPGLHGVLHRPVRLGQVHHRQRAAGEAARDGRPPGHPARRRPGAQEPVVGAGLLQGAPRHQHPAHRLRGLGDHQERRHRHLRPHRPLRLGAQGRAHA